MSSTPNSPSVRAGTRVLVVDDHADTLMFLSRLLEKAGCQVTAATGIRDAEGHLNAARFDLIISDLALTDGNGADLMRRARQRHAIKGIALSGFDSPEERRQCEEAGFAEHLVKPVDLPRLIEAMQRTLEG